MDAPIELQPQPLRSYYGEERRCARAKYAGVERRAIEPATEQDHPEEFGLQSEL